MDKFYIDIYNAQTSKVERRFEAPDLQKVKAKVIELLKGGISEETISIYRIADIPFKAVQRLDVEFGEDDNAEFNQKPGRAE